MPIRIKKLIKKVKRNFFKNPLDILITLTISSAFVSASLNILNWLIRTANWSVISNNFGLYFYGSYPANEEWRVLLWISFIFLTSFLTLFSIRSTFLRKALPYIWVLLIPIGIYLLSGGFGLNHVPTTNWGGLSLTLILTFCSASLSLPIGILLAIGRQSKMRLINSFCRLYIDIMRSLPLISILFFGQLLIPLFLPIDIEINRFIRASLAFGLFTAAYVAEDVRGGLQSIEPTQYEAAKVLGLNSRQILQLVIIPQALKTALPALTNQAIGLLQNTSLMSLLGLVELLGISRSILANPQFIGRYLEVYVWLAVVYWFMCTVIALLSRHIEKQISPANSPY